MKLLQNLPSPLGMKREEILELLLREEYGYLPEKPLSVEAYTVKKDDHRFCAGKAVLKTLQLTVRMTCGTYSFPVYYACPKSESPVPAFIHVNFKDSIPDQYQPTEELMDAGYATLTFCYADVSSDDKDFANGLAGVVYKNGRPDGACGKIGLWAYAACAVLEYALTLPELDHGKISVVGHSRLGKTALLAGALDARFYCAVSNNSGCGGAALARENTGESIKAITDTFPYWFCNKYRTYAENEGALPFDQHYLLAANSHHLVYVASAAEDAWACPQNEYLSCVAASEYFKAARGVGFVHPSRLPSIGECFHEGNIGYHLRAGKHYLSREDWQQFIRFLEKHK